jgi:XTP/dITP diphosphohydrolase
VKLYFLTTNDYKVAEAHDYVAYRGIPPSTLELCVVQRDVQEILDHDVDKIVRHKAVQAYGYIRQPCVVEHGGLFIDALNKLPGGVGKIMWNAVGERMCRFLAEDESRAAVARSFLGYCDGRRVKVYIGETRGQVAAQARGSYEFAWDQIFIPDGSSETYGEMGPERKRATSPLFKAWDALVADAVTGAAHP